MNIDKKSQKISTDGGQSLTQNAFASLSAFDTLSNLPNLPNLPDGVRIPASASASASTPAPAPRKNRGRVDVIREKAGRGGKIVTVARGFNGIGLPEKEALAKKMRAACGTGGTVKDGRIEIQGDKREDIARILAEAGFRPVFAGG
jgi:translation initiation factor 1